MSETPPPSFYGHGDEPDTRTQQIPARPAYGTPHGDGFGDGFGAHPTPTPPPPRPRRTGLAAAVLTGSLVLGTLGGLGGAAAWDAWLDEDEGTGPVQSGTTTQVIDQGTSEAGAGSVEAVAEKVLPSVVRIDVAGTQESGSGSGIVLSEDGRILTNEHVVGPAEQGGRIMVSFADGTRATAEVLGTDPLTDTAVIQAQDVSNLTPATIGQSGNLRVGQQVVAIGSPFGLDATVTSGIVSALGRPVNVGPAGTPGTSTTYPAIQTDAAINPGNSGGPLVDMTGTVVGINSSIRTASSATGGQAGSIGLGFAIPIDEIVPIVEQMAAGQTPTHAQMGISVSDNPAALVDEEGDEPAEGALGALVRSVSPGSSAAGAGLEEGDVITRVDESVIEGADDLVATVRTYRPGDEVELTFVRDGEEQTATLTLDSDADD